MEKTKKRILPDQIAIDLDAVQKIPIKLAQKYKVLGVAAEGEFLTVLASEGINDYGLEDIRQITGMTLRVLFSEEPELECAIAYHYAEVQARQAAMEANGSEKQEVKQMEIEEGDGDTPIIKLLDSLVKRAYHNNASDIHLEPFENHTMVRMRIDGMMDEYVTLRKHLHQQLITRIKILGNMDIVKRRTAQDGHFRMSIDGTMVNMRVSVVPTIYGEKAVIRLLAGNSKVEYVETFGMQEEVYQTVTDMIKAPNGLIYLTGPTGSGKTTTLYLLLKELAKRAVNICTIEDPVERNLNGVNQTQIDSSAGMTFENGLRALLRQDPDIIMVGETRDTETASISVRAAITGHLVLSTLHTNDALSAVIRLKDMGIEPYLIASSLTGVIAQRLLRKLCRHCAKTVEAGEADRKYLGADVRKIKVPVGCPRCGGSGYSGRIAVHEVVRIDRTMREMIADGTDMEQMRRYAKDVLGMKTIRENGSRLVAEGITSMEELRRAAYYV